jgi:GST-like protein
MTIKLYHFPSPNPQKVTFALKELDLDCEIVPVDLAKGEQREAAFRAVNPFGRVPVLVDGDLTLTESQAILVYLGEKTGRLWPTSASARGCPAMAVRLVTAHHAAGRPGGAADPGEGARYSGR